MSSIDEVIARSQQGAKFSERRTFSVARQSAIQKMRKFALADPHYYVLELIQAAIANGATYIDLAIADSDVRMSYVGGGFSEAELSQLFDFLFASKDDLEIADARQLALGINALLLTEPKQITIESGDGTLEGTTRVEIHTRTDEVIVGRPDKPLKGTFLSVVGMNRGKLKGGGQIREHGIIENRCLSAMIPIIVNDDSIFGFTTQRVPKLFGFPRSIEFDEGDLYGSIGIATTAYSENFKLLTHGVWVESVKYDLLPGKRLGGVIAFDRLRKTADHASIVQDEVFNEMWARLRPYARQLASGRSGRATFEVELIDSPNKLTAVEIREIIEQNGGAISVSVADVASKNAREMAKRFGAELDLPIFVSSATDSDTVGLLAGDNLVLRPQLTEFELEFYSRPLSTPPERPWVIAAQQVEQFTIGELTQWLGGPNGVLSKIVDATLERWMREVGDPTAEVKTTIFTPSERKGATSLQAEVRTAGRTVWRGDISSAYPGHSLVIEFPSASPTRLASEHEHRPFAAHIAEQIALHATSKLEGATKLALQTLDQRDPEPDSALSRIVLGALARGTMKRLRTNEAGEQDVVLTILSPELDQRALRVPLVTTMSGKPVTGLDLERMLEKQHGLIYGTIPEVPAALAGIDPDRVLKLDLASERMMVGLVGEGSYIRIDGRDELARIGDHVVRDIYLPAGDATKGLLTEGRTKPDAETEEQIVNRLMHVFLGSFPDAELDMELRRQASRHLIWYVTSKFDDESQPSWLFEIPLFRATDGATVGYRQIASAHREGRLRMADGWSVDCADLAELGYESDPDAEYDTIAMNPFAYHALRRAYPVHATMDYPVGQEIEFDSAEMLVEMNFESPLGVGRLGIPKDSVANPAIAIVDAESQRVGTIESISARFGVVGMIHLSGRSRAANADLVVELRQASEGLMRRLVTMVMTRETNEAQVIHLLEFASASISFTRQPWGEVSFAVQDALTSAIVDLPLFPTDQGISVAALRFIREFAIHGVDDGSDPARARLASDAPAYLQAWLDKTLDPHRVHSPASTAEDVIEESAIAETELGPWISSMLQQLRPDNLPTAQRIGIFFLMPEADGRARLGNMELNFSDGEFVRYVDWHTSPMLVFNKAHPVVASTLAEPGDKERRTWLLLGAYAQINYDYTAVTNLHEIEFQGRVLRLL